MLRNNFRKKSSDEMEFPSSAEIIKLQGNKQNSLVSKKIDSESKIIEIKENEDTNLFFISVDGSQHSEVALEVTTEDFFKSKINSKLVVMHIYNDKMDHIYNFRNKKETVIENYATKLSRFGKSANFVVEDRKEDTVHPVEQVCKLAYYFKANYLISGYYGIKGPKGDNNELSKGVNYLLSYSMVPTIIFKDTPLREKKKNKGYSWLIVLDRQFKQAIRAFESFVQLIDAKKDFVHGLSLSDFNISSPDEFREPFMNEIQAKGIKNFDYEFISQIKPSSTIIAEKVNYGEVLFDFVVFYNNREKHRLEAANSDTTNIVKNCISSICFFNF
jgi:hypothetical protein